MSVIERDVVLQSVDEQGRGTIDLPVTRLGNIEDTAEVKQAPEEGDFLPIVDGADGGQMKKMPVGAIAGALDGAAVRGVSSAEYEALSEEEKQADVLYVIPDGEGGGADTGTAAQAVAEHNADGEAHRDIRELTGGAQAKAEEALAKAQTKQDELAGRSGQVVGFDAEGKAVAQDGVTMEQVSAAIAQAVGIIPVNEGFPSGGIVIWSGAANAIPEGWALCDGTNGAPDLRDRFVLGAGAGYAVGATGGEATHTLTEAEMPKHTHIFSLNRSNGSVTPSSAVGRYTYAESTAKYISTSRDTGSKGGGSAHNNMPPYYALCYIMKI